MTKINIVLILLTLSLPNLAFGQNFINDTLILEELNAKRLTDSINSPLSASVRKITIDFLINLKIDPSVYYTIEDKEHIINWNRDRAIEFYKLAALRILYRRTQIDSPMVGRIGRHGDAILLIYNNSYDKVIRMDDAE